MEDKEYSAEEQKQFIKGFNEGYVLKEQRSGILETLLNGIVSGNTPHLEGLKAGSAQWDKELNRERIKNSIERVNKGSEKSKDKER